MTNPDAVLAPAKLPALSMLDLVAVRQGGTVRGALDIALATAQHVEKLGFTRYWMAEHHNMEGIASSATAAPPQACWLGFEPVNPPSLFAGIYIHFPFRSAM